MKNKPLVALAVVVVAAGCLWLFRGGSSGVDTSGETAPATPDQAAAQVEQVFQEAQPEIKEAATSAVDAMRKGEYERAVVSLTVVRQQPTLTLQQGMAVHNSLVNLEAHLIQAIENGDPNAKRAYEVLRRSKQK